MREQVKNNKRFEIASRVYQLLHIQKVILDILSAKLLVHPSKQGASWRNQSTPHFWNNAADRQMQTLTRLRLSSYKAAAKRVRSSTNCPWWTRESIAKYVWGEQDHSNKVPTVLTPRPMTETTAAIF